MSVMKLLQKEKDAQGHGSDHFHGNQYTSGSGDGGEKEKSVVGHSIINQHAHDFARIDKEADSYKGKTGERLKSLVNRWKQMINNGDFHQAVMLGGNILINEAGWFQSSAFDNILANIRRAEVGKPLATTRAKRSFSFTDDEMREKGVKFTTNPDGSHTYPGPIKKSDSLVAFIHMEKDEHGYGSYKKGEGPSGGEKSTHHEFARKFGARYDKGLARVIDEASSMEASGDLDKDEAHKVVMAITAGKGAVLDGKIKEAIDHYMLAYQILGLSETSDVLDRAVTTLKRSIGDKTNNTETGEY